MHHVMLRIDGLAIEFVKPSTVPGGLVYGDCLAFGASLKWAFEKLQFLTLQLWLHTSALDVGIWSQIAK